MPDINEPLRDYVTGTTFHLSLGKTHIAALVELEDKLKKNQTFKEQIDSGEHHRRIRYLPRVFRLYVPGMNGLIQRGLVQHILPDEYRSQPKSTLDLRPRKIWRITAAGRLVIKLLQEAGVYQEYAQHFTEPATTEKDVPEPDAALAS
jgi:hypothetical protein